MNVIFENYFKHILIVMVAVLFLNFTATSQCTPNLKTSPSTLEGCEDFTVQFFDSTLTDAGCLIQSRQWDFGDGSPTTGTKNPVHVYSAGANGDTSYTAKLSIQDQFNVWSSQSVTVNVFKRPFVDFELSKDTVCAFNETFCTVNSSESGSGYQYRWDFETGISSSYDTCYIFDADGDYTVRLNVTDNQGCISSAERPIAVNEIPNPDFTISPFSGCHPLPATFTNTTNPGTFPITGWSWNFAGYGTSTLETPGGITFPDPGLFVIKLTATNSAGCINTTENNFLVRETPTAEFNFDPEVCVNENVTFIYSGTASPTADYKWKFTDALLGNDIEQGPKLNSWPTGGEFEIELQVTENACSDTVIQTIKINDLPEVTLNSDAPGDSVCELELITFTALPDSFVSYQFMNYGVLLQDSTSNTFSIDTLKSPNEITVIAVDSNNCASTASSNIEITVLPKPITLIFSSDANDTICEGESLTISATGSFDSYTFYDGFLNLQSSNSSNYTSTEIEADNNIYAIATDLGCEGFPSNSIHTEIIPPLPKPQLNCGESTTNSVSWSWTNIDGALGYEISVDGGPFENPNFGLGHLKPGMFFGDSAIAVVHALGSDPCGNSIESDTIKCYAIPCQEIGFDVVPYSTFCNGDTINLQIENINTQGVFEISYNDSLINDSSITFIGNKDSLINVKLTDISQPGCPSFSLEMNVIVNPIPTFNLLLSVDTVCKNDEIIATADSAGYSNYRFEVNNSLYQDSAYHILQTSFSEDLDKEIVVTALEKGCTFSDSVYLYVVPTPPNDLSLSSESICQGERITFSGTAGYNRYNFSKLKEGVFVSFLDSTINEYEVFAGEPEDIIVSLVAFDDNNCASLSVIDTAEVKPLPIVEIGFDQDSVCENSPLKITSDIQAFDDYTLFENFFPKATNDSGIFVLNAPINGKYYSVQAVSNGCLGPISNQIQAVVKDSLPTPDINCGTTGSGIITFVWDPVAGNEGYNATFDTPSGIVNKNNINGLSYSITGLTAGDTVWASVQANSSGPCGPSLRSKEVFCIMPCLGVTFQQEDFPSQLCVGDSVDLGIKSINVNEENYVIQWYGKPASKNLSARYTNLTKGIKNFTIAVSDSTQSHCPATEKKFTIEVFEYPVVTLIGPTDICGDTAIVFSASPRSYDSYAFYDGFVKIQDTINPEVIDYEVEDGHFYSVVATNNGCSDTSNAIEIAVTDPLEIPDVYCGASGLDSIELRWDSVPNASDYEISINGFPWQSPSDDFIHIIRNLNPEDTVNFSVRAIGGLPCGPGERSDRIRCVAKPCHFKDFTLPSDTLICEGDSIELYPRKPISISGQRGFSYDFGATFSSDSALTVSPKNDKVYSLRMIDSTELQCPYIEKKIKVNVHPVPEFVLNNSTENDTVCEGEVVIFTADTAGFDVYQTYINGILVLDTNYFEFRTDSMGNGIQKVYMTAYDDVCFFTSDTQVVNVVSFPELVLTSSDVDLEICAEDTVVFSANAGFDTYNYYQIFGTDTTLLKSSSDSDFVTNQLINESTIYVEGINSNTCAKTTANFDFTVFPIPQPILTSSDNDNIICGLDTLIFEVQPDTLDGYQFYDNDELVDFGGHIYATDSLKPGNGIYVIATEDGCSNSSDTIYTSVEFTPTITSGLDTNEICLGDTIQLWVSGGDTKTWSTGETADTITLVPQLDTDYWVTGTTGNCTSPVDTFEIDIDDDIPVPDAGEDTTICIGDSIELVAFGGTTYLWYPEDSVSNPSSDFTYTKVSSTQYITLEAKNKHCVRKDSVKISIDLCLKELPDGIPNGVTPNGDGTNDTWDIPFIWYFKNNNVKIYNRWSNLVFKTDYYQGDWGGTNRNGNPLPDGTYFYVLDLGNGREPYLGYIIIHR